MMERRLKIELYLTTLKEALENDNQNDGFYVRGPEDYLSSEDAAEIDSFIESEESGCYHKFFDAVGVYFDAKSHYAAEIDGKNIDQMKAEIIKEIEKIKAAEGLR